MSVTIGSGDFTDRVQPGQPPHGWDYGGIGVDANDRIRLGAPHAGTDDGTFIAPHTVAIDLRGDLYVGEVPYAGWTSVFPKVPKPDRIRSLPKFAKV